MTENQWIERATELAAAANRCLRASTECLREAEQARLTAERERPLADEVDLGVLPGAPGSPHPPEPSWRCSPPLRSVG